MVKLLFFFLLIWVFLKIRKIFSRIQIFKNDGQKKEGTNRKAGMEIMDVDYEEVE